MSDIKHITKYEYSDGVKLQVPEMWCGVKESGWRFQDAQHAALASEGSARQCKKCLKAIIKALSVQL